MGSDPKLYEKKDCPDDVRGEVIGSLEDMPDEIGAAADEFFKEHAR